MSELTPCNHCTLKKIKSDAKKEEKKVILRRSEFMGGVLVFVIPQDIELPDYKEPSETLPNGDDNYQKYNVSWMMEVSDHCCC